MTSSDSSQDGFKKNHSISTSRKAFQKKEIDTCDDYFDTVLSAPKAICIYETSV